MAVAPQLQCAPGVTRQLAQIVRTQAQDGKRDIEKIYLKAVNNATQFIYIENPVLSLAAIGRGDQSGGRSPNRRWA